MRRIALLANAVFIGWLLAPVSPGCAQERKSRTISETRPTEVAWGEAVDGWQLGVSLLDERDPIPWGDPVRVRVYLKNVSRQSREVQYGPLFTLHRFQLKRVIVLPNFGRDKANPRRELHTAPLTRYGRSLIEAGELGPVKSATLEPNHSLTQDLFLSRCFDISHGGEHHLIVRRLVSDGENFRIVETPVLKINIETAPQIPTVVD